MKELSTPDCKLVKILPQSGGQSFTIAAGSTQEVLFEIPAYKAFIPSQLAPNYTMTVSAQTAYSWLYQKVFGEIQQIQVYTRGGAMVMDLNYANNFQDVVKPVETKYQEYTQHDTPDALYPSQLAASQNVRFDGTTASINLLEPRYCVPSGNAAAAAYLRQPRGSSWPNTFLSLDKEVMFPEIIVLRIVFGTKCAWTGTSNVNPATGAGALAGTGILLENMTLFAPFETRPEITKGLMEKIQSGWTLPLPYVWGFKNNLAGDTQVVQQKLSKAYGMFAQKIYHAVYHKTENTNTMYDHTNIAAGGAASAKVTSYYTNLDNLRRQEFDIKTSFPTSTTQQEDYLQNKRFLAGSAIQNKDMYRHLWFHRDDFTGSAKTSESDIDSFKMGGLDLKGERIWSFYANVVTDTYNHYTFVCAIRNLSIKPDQIAILQ